MSKPGGFRRIDLDERHHLYLGRLPDSLILDDDRFEAIWSLHPTSYHEIRVHHRLVKTPRWQQAYGRSYVFSGSESPALPIPGVLAPLLGWCKATVHTRLNGLLLNWYDGALGHYISAHRDSRRNLIAGAPIVTLSFGEERIFRLRPYRGKGRYIDLDAVDGDVFIMPYATNLAWTHELPRLKRYRGRRISVTVRAFDTGGRCNGFPSTKRCKRVSASLHRRGS
ncbi:alpha-ketoglutarate-dependent dioxygenase AlkB [Candidatus Rariloculus sp.]|uniref:alpha-ketoglutarate-dependent dioxygenase AlkB n=1 Tax=Candidatus Rariloculus sp. TaxID=3101265 RepID=UPI003D10F9EB